MKTVRKQIFFGIILLAALSIPLTLFLNKSSTDLRSKAQIAPTPVPVNIRITTPSNGVTISGKSVRLSSESQNLTEQLNQQYFIDGFPIGESLMSPPYVLTWDSTTIVNGKHTLTSQLTHEGERPLYSAPVTITVNNPDDTIRTAAEGTVADGPTLAAVAADDVQSQTAQIQWTTDEPATTQLTYTANGASSTTTLNPLLTTEHHVTVTNLQPESSYTYQAKSKDQAGNETTSLASEFTTAAVTPQIHGQWTDAINWPLSAVHTTLLYTGEVLMWDAWETTITKAKLWNPTTQVFKDVPVNVQIFCSAHTMLSDGKILIVGGHFTANAGLKNVTVFDPATNQWSQGVPVQVERWYGGLHRLADDNMLVVGGKITPTVFADTPEIYNLTHHTSTLINTAHTSLFQDAQYPLMFTLPNGKIFATSTQQGSHMLYDVASQTWTHFGAHTTLFGSAVQYRPGKLLMTGGSHALGGMAVTDAAIMDMNSASPVWNVIAPMNSGRYFHSLVMMPDGKVFTAGGIDSVNIGSPNGPLTAEIWDPDTHVWSSMAPISRNRLYHNTTLLLPDARILLAGSGTTAQIFSPPYLFAGARPSINSAPATTQYGATMQIGTPDAARIKKISLISLGANTHSNNFDQYYSELLFTQNGNGLAVQMPTNKNIAPPGYYMVFILDTNGVPSVSKIVKLENVTVTPTPTPTQIPAPTPTPTRVPTPTAAPTLTPTPKPTSTPVPSATKISLTLFLHGLGNGGDNVNPKSVNNFTLMHPQRTVTIQVLNSQNQLVVSKQGSVQFNAQTGNFIGTVDLGTGVNTGTYIINIKTDQFLRTAVPGIQVVTAGSTMSLPAVTLVGGDISNDNTMNIFDYNILRDCYSDISAAINCSSTNKVLADLDDDGFVNQLDYNLFIREASIVRGQ